MRAIRFHRSVYILLLLPALSSCVKNHVYDRNLPLPAAGWAYGEPRNFTVHISDTISLYNMYINFRHTDAYPYNNIWVKLKTVMPDSSVEEKQVNVILSKSSGQWTGSCIDGICYNSVLTDENIVFHQTGDYTFSLEQDMRMHILPEVMNVGIRLEKFGEREFTSSSDSEVK